MSVQHLPSPVAPHIVLQKRCQPEDTHREKATEHEEVLKVQRKGTERAAQHSSGSKGTSPKSHLGCLFRL